MYSCSQVFSGVLTHLSDSIGQMSISFSFLRCRHVVHCCWQSRLLGALLLERLAAGCELQLPLSRIAVHEVPILALEVMVESASNERLGFSDLTLPVILWYLPLF